MKKILLVSDHGYIQLKKNMIEEGKHGAIYGAMTKNKEKGSQAITYEPAYLLAPRVGLEPTT